MERRRQPGCDRCCRDRRPGRVCRRAAGVRQVVAAGHRPQHGHHQRRRHRRVEVGPDVGVLVTTTPATTQAEFDEAVVTADQLRDRTDAALNNANITMTELDERRRLGCMTVDDWRLWEQIDTWRWLLGEGEAR